MDALSALQQDALCEIFNISVGQAAATMSEMVNEEVMLSVPEVQFVSLDQAAAHLDQGNQRICGVSQTFDGTFHGNALLIFPESRSLELVRLMVGKNLPLEHLTELEQDALSEVGNIILNACLASLSDVFQHHFACGLPALHVGSGMSVLNECGPDQVVMLLHIRFTLAERLLDGYVVFVMNASSLELLGQALNQFLGAIPNTTEPS